MNWMKKTLLTGLCLTTGWVSAAKGGMDSGGGSGYAAEFIEYGKQVVKILEEQPKLLPVSSAAFREAVFKTKIEMVDVELRDDDGHIVDALNYPDKSLIRVNRVRWFELFANPRFKLQLVAHEYLGILKVDDTGYQLSKRIAQGGQILKSLTCNYTNDSFSGQLTYLQIDRDLDGTHDEVKAIYNVHHIEYPAITIFSGEAVSSLASNNGVWGLSLTWSDALTNTVFVPYEDLKKDSGRFIYSIYDMSKFGKNGPIPKKYNELFCTLS